MEYTKLKCINQYKSESINPAKTPDTIFEMYSVPVYETGHPEYLRGDEIASNKAVVQKDDILLCKINPRINRVWVVSNESDKQNIASSEWIVIRNSEYNPEFLAWYFRTPKFQKLMTSEVTGIGGSLTRAQPKCVAEYPVPVMDRKKQDEIVNVLNKCKFVVDSRQKELLELDDLIKARFVELFGNPDINEKNWNVYKMEQLCEVGSSKRIYQNDQSLTGIPFLRISDLVNRMDTGSKDCDLFIPEELFEKFKKQGLVPARGDILLTARGTLGRCYIIQAGDEFYFQDGMITWLSKFDEKITPLYISYLFEMPEFRKQIDSLQAGSTVAYLSISMTKKLNVMVPPMELQNQFADFVHQVNKSKLLVQKSLDETQVLFNSLMQKYFG